MLLFKVDIVVSVIWMRAVSVKLSLRNYPFSTLKRVEKIICINIYIYIYKIYIYIVYNIYLFIWGINYFEKFFLIFHLIRVGGRSDDNF